jgi:hypothetical protein
MAPSKHHNSDDRTGTPQRAFQEGPDSELEKQVLEEMERSVGTKTPTRCLTSEEQKIFQRALRRSVRLVYKANDTVA